MLERFEDADFRPVAEGEGISQSELEVLSASMRSDRIPNVNVADWNGVYLYRIRYTEIEMFAFDISTARKLALMILVGSI
jgi:hypothetical protein